MAEVRVRVIPDRIFHKLWDGVSEFGTVQEYIDAYTNPLSKRKIKFDVYKLDYVQTVDLLNSIFIMYNKSIKELLDENNIKVIELSHRCCIPIRTLENWIAGLRNPPDYIKIFIIEAYNISFLPRFIYTESSNKKRIRYNETNENKEKSQEIVMTIDERNEIRNEIEEDDDFTLIDKKMLELEERRNNRLNSYKDIITSTSYLDDIIKSRK